MKIKGKIPLHVQLLFRQLLFVLVLMTVTRVIFHVFNRQAFSEVSISDYLVGIWFDCVTAALFFLPYLIVYAAPIPLSLRRSRWYKAICAFIFLSTAFLIVGLNLMDIEYFKYTSKRSTIDLLAILSAGSDLKQLIVAFITDFWYLIILFAAAIYGSFRFYLKNSDTAQQEFSFLRHVLYYVCVIGLFVFVGRGGFVFKPVGVLDASRFTDASKTALVLNTPFTMVKSIGSERLKEATFYTSIQETERYFNPVKTSHPQHVLPDGTNVVILILESFGKEFIGYYSQEKTYTPFLDSLLTESMTFDAGFANGKKSIEAVPSIFASIPSLQDNPYISSPYNSNRIVGLPELLKQHGYESAFFHGATNGSMRFDAFADYIGFDHYFGRKEYGNDAHFDQTWGISDEYFNPWTAKQLSTLKQPFLATLFTISSHHPFYIPEHRKKEVIYGPQPLCAAISYGDLSLKLFFEEAKKQSWYNNTVFVICADHTPGTETDFYNLLTQLYQIPFAIYHPGGKLPKGKSEKLIQQIDIYPTILDLLNIDADFYSFGSSIYDKVDRFSVSYLEGNYFYFEKDKMLVFSGNQARNLYDFKSRDNSLVDVSSTYRKEIDRYEQTLKAIIQRYNHDLIRNKTTAIK